MKCCVSHHWSLLTHKCKNLVCSQNKDFSIFPFTSVRSFYIKVVLYWCPSWINFHRLDISNFKCGQFLLSSCADSHVDVDLWLWDGLRRFSIRSAGICCAAACAWFTACQWPVEALIYRLMRPRGLTWLVRPQMRINFTQCVYMPRAALI